MTTPVLAEPLAVWDVHDRGNVYWRDPDKCFEWVKEALGLNGDSRVWKIEFYDGIARLFRFHANAEGKPHLVRVCGEYDGAPQDACRIPPYDVELAELPPAGLL